MVIGLKKEFAIGDSVFVAAQNYTGEVVELRDVPGGEKEYLIRYSVPNGRKPYYETWWPSGFLVKSAQ